MSSLSELGKEASDAQVRLHALLEELQRSEKATKELEEAARAMGATEKQAATMAASALQQQQRATEAAAHSTHSFTESMKEGYGTAKDIIGQVVEAVHSIATAAAANEQHVRAVTQLGAAYEMVSTATNGTVSAEEALHAQQTISQSGLRISGDQLATLARKAREFAIATGGDARQEFEKLTEAVRDGSADALGQFGIAAGTSTSRARNLETAVGQINREFRGVAPSARTMDEQLAITGRAWDTFKGQIAGSISEAVHLQEVLGTLAGAVTKLGTAAGQVSESTWSRILSIGAGAAGIGARLALDREHLGNFVRNTGNAVLPGLGTSLAPQAQALVDSNRAALGIASHPATTPTAGTTPQGPLRDQAQGGGGGSSTAGQVRELTQQLTELQQRARFDHIAVGEQARQAHETQVHFLTRRVEATRTAIEMETGLREGLFRASFEHDKAEREQLEESARGKAQAAEQFNNQLDSAAAAVKAAEAVKQQALRDTTSDTLQASRAFADMVELHETGAQAMGAVLTSTWGAATGALKQHTKAVIEGKETVGEALKAVLHETLVSLATEAGVKAVFQLAQGLGNVAALNFPGAAANFASMAAFGVVAGLAGVGAAVTAPSVPVASAAASSQPTPAPSAGGPSGMNSSGTTTVNYVYQVQGNAYHGEQSADEVAKLMRDAHRRGTA